MRAPASRWLRGARAGAEPAGGLDHDIDPELRPGQPAGIVLGEDGDPDSPTIMAPSATRPAGKAAVDGVVAEEGSERGGVGDVVDGDDLDVGAALWAERGSSAPTRPKPLIATRTVMAHDGTAAQDCVHPGSSASWVRSPAPSAVAPRPEAATRKVLRRRPTRQRSLPPQRGRTSGPRADSAARNQARNRVHAGGAPGHEGRYVGLQRARQRISAALTWTVRRGAVPPRFCAPAGLHFL